MPRRSRQGSPEQLREKLIDLLQRYESELASGELREKVKILVSIQRTLSDLGCSLITGEDTRSGRGRILRYLLTYPQTVISGKELAIVAGISEWARRTRELRVEHGWALITGVTAKAMLEEEELGDDDLGLSDMAPNDYMLLHGQQDIEAAERWQLMNQIRKERFGVREKIIKYLRANVGKPISGEELRYIAKDRTEWARRTRELRTDYGWPVVTRNTGRPDLPVGVYLLEQDRQSPEHDRHIPDPVRRAVLRRDGYRCTECEWNFNMWNRADPRFLELHHIDPHAEGGSNEEVNLTTLCTVCHDQVHRG
jgi:hypothetical protein